MLPSCGHFKTIPCPFYKLALCVRPHCPYKHQSPENGQRQLFSPLVDDTDSLFDSKVNLDAILHKSSYNSAIIQTQENATYIPTPVDTNSKPPGILKSSNSNLERASSSFVPEYKPTPISKLKEYSSSSTSVKSVKSEYSPEYPTTIRKKKNVEEYDPTEVKCIPKKTVTFADQTDPSISEIPVILISSDEDLDDSECAPQFSDDDVEDDVPSVSDSVKQVPEVIIVKQEDDVIEDVKIDEYSVVDKILVDCKKNEMLLNSYQKLKVPSKTIDLSSKVTSTQKQDRNKKSEVKSNKSNSNISIKTDKNTNNVTGSKSDNRTSNIKPKPKKDENSDTNNSKGKKCDNIKKESKTDRSDVSKGKVQKSSSSHSFHNKEKLKKSSKESDKSKHSKKISSESRKSNSRDSKSSKSSTETLNKKNSKKKVEGHSGKHGNSTSNPDTKKSKLESGLKSSDSKEKNLSNKHSMGFKRKSDISDSDSDSEQHSSKNKYSSDVKKLKSDVSVDTKKTKLGELNSDHVKSKTEDQLSDFDVDDDISNDIISSSESDPNEECRRIFNECYPEDSEPVIEDKKEVISETNASKTTDLTILRKKRYAHPAAAVLKKPPSKVPKTDMKKPLPPAQVMYNRFAECQAKFAQLNENKDMARGGMDKKRISFAPSQNLLAAVKNKVNQSNAALSNFSPLPPTVSKTLKVTKRTAHIPEVAMKPRPIIPAGYGSKVPSGVRQKYLNAFIDECLKFCSSEDEAYELGLDEEKKVYERSSSKALYLNVAANALKRLRRQAEEGPKVSGSNSASSKSISSKPEKKTVSHETLLNGPLAQRRSFSIGRKKEAPEIKGGAALYEYLLTYVLTPEQLKENSYPLPHPTERDRAVIEGAYSTRSVYCNDAFKRTCCRCRKTYYVNVDGDYVRDEECDFHWGRLWKKRIAGCFESRYSCCQGDAESDGCCVSTGHVFEGSESHALKGYVKTLPKTPPPDNCYGIYALDCEMCYTTAGMELTRVTVVDSDLKPVYESYVKPQHRVLDYNTRFSGITEDNLKNVRTSIHDVQAVLLCIFSDKTILIGHSLESDFKALKLFHSTVVDTSVVFPHKNGLPFKRALRTLMAEKLNKIIQNDVGGHDSQEDAVACMELMLWKIKEDIRGNR